MPDLTPDEYEALKADVARRGVLVPVEVDTDGNILDGHHRVQVATDLGIGYPRVVRSGLSHEERLAHALALNLNRRHLSPEARANAVVALRRQGWSTRRISRATGVSQSTIVRDLHSGDPAGSPEVVTGSDGKRYAGSRPRPLPSVYVATAREQQRAQTALQALGEDAPGKVIDLRRAERLVRDERSAARRSEPPFSLPSTVRIEHKDFRDLDIEAGSVDLLLSDPPYTSEAFRSGLWTDLAEHTANWLRQGGYAAVYCGQLHLPDALTALTSAGLSYWWCVSVQHDRGTGTAYVRQRAVANGWKPVLILRQPGGDPPKQTLPDVIAGTGRAKETGHPLEQAVGEAEHLIRALTGPGAHIVDPCLGSGTTAVAAVRTGRQMIGCDINAEYVATARQRVTDALVKQQ